MKLVIINYGAGNTQSVKYAFQRLGVTPILSNNAEEILAADKVIFPGVGHAQAAMNELKAQGLDTLIPQLKQHVLGICLGMQLLCKFSEEGGTPCLGIIDETVKLFNPTMKVPHMGWQASRLGHLDNKVFNQENVQTYYVHSYYIPINQYTVETCDYINPFTASLQKDNFYACQYHPEKSGKVGEQILKNFLAL
ncbi:MAG: imidazole glycerol phosphate synthase subunit HisH [Flavobacteriales bacterium]